MKPNFLFLFKNAEFLANRLGYRTRPFHLWNHPLLPNPPPWRNSWSRGRSYR